MIREYKELIMNRYSCIVLDICLRNHLIEFEYLINGGFILILWCKIIKHLIVKNWNLKTYLKIECNFQC